MWALKRVSRCACVHWPEISIFTNKTLFVDWLHHSHQKVPTLECAVHCEFVCGFSFNISFYLFVIRLYNQLILPEENRTHKLCSDTEINYKQPRCRLTFAIPHSQSITHWCNNKISAVVNIYSLRVYILMSLIFGGPSSVGKNTHTSHSIKRFAAEDASVEQLDKSYISCHPQFFAIWFRTLHCNMLLKLSSCIISSIHFTLDNLLAADEAGAVMGGRVYPYRKRAII